ncbi:MAG: hypothetical protein EOO13_15970 [Chitinophagaceae bacterium]|nr:MAG: hypothetical protein EOO13_15970 [Chitinophagaceae bacterium]
MRRKRLTLLFFCTSIMFCLGAQELTFIPTYEIAVKYMGQKEILKQCSRVTPKAVEGYWLVDTLSVQKLHTNFKKVQKLRPDCCTAIGGQVRNLEPYAFQYLGIIINGKKMIYINAFLKERFEDFREALQEKLVNVCDGGTDFWGVLFDVYSGSFQNLSVNGGG